MRARMAASFALGVALGALCLGAGLWRSGALATVAPPWKRAAVPAAVNLPVPAAVNLSDLMADLGKQPPPPLTPPAMEPFDFPKSAPAGAAAPGSQFAPARAAVPDGQPAPAGTAVPGSQAAPIGSLPPGSPAGDGGRFVPIGPRPPIGHGESDRMAPDRTGLPHLAMPLSGIDPKKLADNFSDARGGHKHEALDISAPRGTPVLAVVQGNVAKLFTSKPGGLTVYQFDDSRTYCYYYAHLDRYAAGIQDGTLLRAGEVLGYVGSTGNASSDAPHLHFAVFKLGPEKKWWEGTAIDPLPMLK